MITFFGAWFALAFIALVFNYAIHGGKPDDDNVTYPPENYDD